MRLLLPALLLALPAAAQYAEGPVTNGGTIKGRITYNGKPPPVQKISVTKDPGRCCRKIDWPFLRESALSAGSGA